MKKIIAYSPYDRYFENMLRELENENYRVDIYYDVDQFKIVQDFEDCSLVVIHTSSYSSNLYCEQELIEHVSIKTTIPIIVLGDSIKTNEQIRFLEKGADRYLTTPIQPDELFVHIKTAIRTYQRIRENKSKVVKYGDIEMNASRRRVFVHGKDIHLTPIEYKILNVLVNLKGHVVSKEKIIDYIWPKHDSATMNALDIHVSRLRKKMIYSSGKGMIKTIRGHGYCFDYDCTEQG